MNFFFIISATDNANANTYLVKSVTWICEDGLPPEPAKSTAESAGG